MATVRSWRILTVRVPVGLHLKAKVKAAKMDVTISQIVRKALWEWVKDGDDISPAA